MPRASGLGAAGKALRKQILAGLPEGWELDEREAAVLDLAARQADVVAALEKVAQDEGAMAVGSTGQPTVHPAIVEARLGRLAIDRLLGKIVLPSPEKQGETAASARARHGGNARLAVAKRKARRRGAA